MTADAIDPSVPPSGDGCVECEADGGWWLHLRRCATCGHIGCCDTSPRQHATQHWKTSGHPVITSFEPDEDWFWNFETHAYEGSVRLASPTHRPLSQSVPGPAERVPADWEAHLH
jgi:ubiquitin-hydrolase Zn-finger-containing protein